jgi:hypothetical protein
MVEASTLAAKASSSVYDFMTLTERPILGALDFDLIVEADISEVVIDDDVFQFEGGNLKGCYLIIWGAKPGRLAADGSYFSSRALRRARQRPPMPNSPPKIPSATLAGSGTAVMSSPQLTTVLWAPPDRSAKKSVQVPFGFRPL